MTALYMDGFDHYGSNEQSQGLNDWSIGPRNMLDGNWVSVSGSDTTGGAMRVNTPSWGPARTGAYCLSTVEGGGTLFARKVFDSPENNIFVSIGFAMDSLPNTTFDRPTIFDLRSNSNVVMYSIGVNPSGQVQLWSGDQVTLIATTAGQVVNAQTWHFFEMNFNLDAGTFVMRADDPTGAGTPILTGALTSGQVAYGFAIGQSAGSSFAVPKHFDDLYVRNGSGDVNNGFQGDRRVATMFPNSDTDEANWTPSYYKEFGAGILRLSYKVPNSSTLRNPDAITYTAGATSLNVGSADFTLETFLRWDALPLAANYSTIFSRWDVNANKRSYRFILGGSSFNGGCLQVDTSTDGTSSTVSTPIVFPWTPLLNEWYHVALVRASGELLLFVNGEQMGLPIADSSTWYSGDERFIIGGQANGNIIVQGTQAPARYDETRFTNGVARYTGPFAVPTQAFPRGPVLDPDWSSVVLLCGYNSGIIDESSYSRLMSVLGNAISFIPSDGPDLGLYTTVNKATPDDNTFISAFLTNATNILTMTTQPTNGTTVTVGTTDGTIPAVYTFKTTLVSAYDVLIDTTAQNTLINLLNAINQGPGGGTKYGVGTVANWDVNAVQLPVGQIEIVADTAGVIGNSITCTSTSTASWDTPTLTGGLDIPGPTNFKFQRPPSNTTIISALQTTIRAQKTDAGLATVQTAFIAPLGGVATGEAHPLNISISYFNDIIEEDPDTNGPLSPTTIIGGQLQINRTE